MIGTTLGHYRILRLVGKGGMGEVYAAEDLTLGRTVAVKVLPADLQARVADLDRFEREARAAAALNHPGIVTLHSFEQADGVRFITMELVDGVPLSSGIRASGLPFEELLRLAFEIADAVAAAHDRGIVHRDLKPANVLVTAEGRAKILDFGLAKLREPEGPAGDRSTRQVSAEGRIVGTVAYMSPEQAEGRPVDHRTDIFSLGIMLYELATGQRPFQGDTSMSVLSAVLRDTPRPATELNPAVPQAFARVLRMCLHKDPERRYQSAKDLRNELRALKEELDSGDLAQPALRGSAPSPRVSAGRWPLIAAGLALVAILAVSAALWQPIPTDEAPLELQHLRLTSTPGIEREPTLSPDGLWFLFVSTAAGNSDIYLQSVSGQTQINLTKDSPAADAQPMFSPDGDSIAFRSARDGGGLYIMGRTGEAPRRVSSEGFDPAWSPDGRRLAYATGSTSLATSRVALSQLRTVDIASGQVTAVTDQDAMHPAWSPDGRFIAYWGLGRTIDGDEPISVRDLWVVPADGGTSWRVTDDVHVNWCPQWNADGAFLYYVSNRGGSMNLWRLPMNPETGRPIGAPQAVTTPAGYVGRARLSFSGEHVVYEARAATRNIHRASFDASVAAIGPVEAVTTGSRIFNFVNPSPDGRLLVLGTGFLQEEDLYISDADGSNLRQLTTDRFNDRHPVWSPDGSEIAFYSDRSGKYELWATTPAGQLRQITDTPDFSPLYPRWSPDGSRMAFTDSTNRRAVVVFDPRAPWQGQTPDVLPPPAGPDSYLVGTSLAWSPDSARLAGTVNGVVTIYDIASRQYRPVGEVRGVVYAWLRDGRLLVGPPTAPRLVDPDTGSIRPLGMPSFGEETPFGLRLSDDERLVYFSLSRSDADIWLVTLVQK